MEIELKRISYDADIYDVRKAVELVLHGPDLYDPNAQENKGRKPNFEIVMGESPAGRLHNGTAILRVTSSLGLRLLRWHREEDNNIVVCGRPLRIFNAHNKVAPDVRQTLEKARYVEPDLDRLRTQKEDYASQVRLRVAKLQFGVWFKGPNDRPTQGRAFSIEHEREFLQHSAAYIMLVYEHSLIRIDVSSTLFVNAHITDVYPIQIGQRETEEDNFLVHIKFISIKKQGIGWDEFGQACAYFPRRFCVFLRRNVHQLLYSTCLHPLTSRKRVSTTVFQKE